MADGIASRFDADPITNLPAYSGADERALDAVGWMGAGTNLKVRPGKRPGVGLEVTVTTGPDSAVVQPGGGIIWDPVGGAWRFVLPSTVTKTLATRPSSGTSRIDLVIVRIYDHDSHPETALREVDVEIVTGGASASPSVPDPGDALVLRQLAVPATGTIAVSKPAQRSVASGGILPVADAAERDAILSPYDGLMVYREDTDAFEGRINGGWVVVGNDSGWTTLSLSSGISFSIQTPQVRLRNGVVYFRGFVTKTAGFAASTVTVVVAPGGVPSSMRPPVRSDVQLSGNTAGNDTRGFVDTDGSITVVTGASVPSYVSMAGLSGYLPD